MQAGVGAGLAGLLGGILALGVGKIVGAAVEKLDEAEANAWANDRLKRMMGDVQVSFRALEGSVKSASKQINVTYAEGGRLATQFTKLGNVTAEQSKSIGAELEVAGGMSKAYGLDPSQGVGFMGQMRGVRLTQDEQGSRKLALIIGETIARSGAFAKADEVMDAIAGYASSQARSSLNAGTAAYAGALAGLTGSGMVGLDVAGSSSILNRANAALSAGGAKGEASQFFSASIGAKYGLDPFQLQMWREGGAFATLDDTFGSGSMASKFGMKGPGGNQTWMQATLDELRRRYGNNPGMLANATSNHLGLSMSQSMALLQYQPAQIGEMQRRLGSGFDLKTLNASAIGTMGRILTGDSGVLGSVAAELKGRNDLTGDERSMIDDAMASGNLDRQKDVLMRLVASREQEETDGKNIHDSKVALENIKTDLAQKLIPLTQSIRDGILFMAGGGKKSQYEVNQEILKLESDDKGRRINRIADADIQAANDALQKAEFDILSDPNAKGAVSRQDWWIKYQQKIKDGTITPDEMTDFKHELETAHRLHGARFFGDDTADKLESARRSRDDRLRSIEERRNREIEAERENYNRRRDELDRADRGAGNMANDDQLRRDVAAAEQEIGAPPGLLWAQMEQESGFNPNAVSHAGAMGLAQVMPKTLRTLNRRLGRNLDPFNPRDAVIIQKEVMRENYAKFGNWNDALSAYNGGWDPSRWGNPETSGYAPSINRRRQKWGNGTPMPDGIAGDGGDKRFIFDAAPIEIIHKNERGEQIRSPQMIATTIRPASPFGTERFS
jgi:hypothetical protein